MRQHTMQLLAAAALAMPFTTAAQQYHFGLEGGVGRATQLLYDPTHPRDGTTQLNSSSAWHAGIQASAAGLFHNKVLDFFSYKARLAYARRGATQPFQVSTMPMWPGMPGGMTQLTPFEYNRIRNTVDYLTLDLTLQKRLFRLGQNSGFYLEGGIGNNVLIRSDIKAGKTAPVSYSYPYDRYNDNSLKRYHTTWILGAGLKLEDRYALLVQTNKGITPLHRSATLRVRDWSWSLGASINISRYKPQSGYEWML